MFLELLDLSLQKLAMSLEMSTLLLMFSLVLPKVSASICSITLNGARALIQYIVKVSEEVADITYR